MPGLENGSNAQNAFPWDHSIVPGGTRVYGQNARYTGGGLNQYDWWALDFEQGRTYTIQTRLPTAFNTYLILYSNLVYYLYADNDSGDDGYPLSKIVWTAQETAQHYIRMGGSYYYYDFGPYVLECVPPPVSTKIIHTGGSRFGVRREAGSIVPSRFGVIKEATGTSFASRFLVRSPAEAVNQSRIETRQVASTAWPSRFNFIKTPNGVLSVARFDARRLGQRISISRNDTRKAQATRNIARYDIRQIMETIVPARYEWRKLYEAGPSPSRHDSLVQTGWAIYARDANTSAETFLGFIPEDASPKELLDVSLPDGVYEIEARPSQYFWNECRGRKVVTLVGGTVGGGTTTTGLPVIQNLRREIVSGISRIKWKVTEEYAPGAFDFGVWFSPTTPVDTSGAPDQTVSYFAGVGDYQFSHQQTGDEYLAVAAFTPTEQGPAVELYMPWSTFAPDSPSDQYAYRSEVTP